MDYSVERERIYALLRRCNANLDEFVVGAGETYSHKKLRFEFNASRSGKDFVRTVKYAIKYFAEYDIYLVWQVRQWTEDRIIARSIFTAAYTDVMNAIENHTYVQKGVEFHNRGAERVEVLTYTELENYILGITQDNNAEEQ